MGTIFLEGVLQFMDAADVTVLERTPEHAASIGQRYGVNAVSASTYDCNGAELVILGMKPQDSSTLPQVLGKSAQNSLVLSMIAGISLERLQHLTGATRVVRCMPNTPAKIGHGMTAWTATTAVTAAERALVEKILRSFGAVLAVASDEWIDKTTAVSGSGPAYVFAYAEACLAAAQDLGFSEAEATLLVQQTFAGAIELWQKSQLSPGQLRQQVTSKGGTTAAALAIFEEKNLQHVVNAAVAAAYQRAQVLSREN